MSIEAQRLLIDMYNSAHEMDVTTCFKDNVKREKFIKARGRAGKYIRSGRAIADNYNPNRVTLSDTGTFPNDIYDHSDMD